MRPRVTNGAPARANAGGSGGACRSPALDCPQRILHTEPVRAHDLEVLEYHRVLDKVASFAQSAAGAAASRRLRPHADPAEVAAALDRTAQLAALLRSGESPPSVAVPDISESLKLVHHAGAILAGVQLVALSRVLAAGRELAAFLRRRHQQLPALAALRELLRSPVDLESALRRCLDEEGAVRDEASDELAELRGLLRRLRAEVTQRLERLLHRESLSDVVAERYVTLRNNRYVIPIRAGSAHKVQGVVQDRSASGETLFVEPLFAVELNNELLMAARREERECEKILGDLTDLVRRHLPEVESTFAGLTAFDVLQAKARFAVRYGCTRPSLAEGRVDLRSARQPLLLLSGAPVVPVDLHIPEGKAALVITGPNTGGKTAALKTLGLLSLMAQTGLFLPVAEGSELPCWRGVYADIGDEQSLQRNLSTFSAHVANLIEIERLAAPPSLVLLDEPGIGTEPEEGAALAIGLLRTLCARGLRVAVSTHYTPVKLFALTDGNCVTAAVEFDREALAPRFRLVYHSLGESLGLAIAERLGLGARVLAAARAAQPDPMQELGAALARLEALRRDLEGQSRLLETRAEAVAAKERELDELLQELQRQRETHWRGELEAARAFLQEVREEGRRILAALRERRATQHEFANFLERASTALAAREAEVRPDHGAGAGGLRPGDIVELAGGGIRGELVAVNQGRSWIRRGTMRIEVPTAQLRRVQAAAAPQHRAALERQEWRAEAEVTLIGLRAKDALAKLEKFLDRAAIAGHASVRIIHGLGSGVLRRAVREYLENSPYCSGYRDGEPQEGGAAVTIAQIR